MQDSKIPAAAVETCCNSSKFHTTPVHHTASIQLPTHVPSHQAWPYQQLYAKWKRKTSLLSLIGCVGLLALLYAVLLFATTSGLADVPFLSPRIRSFLWIPHDHELQANSIQLDREDMEVFERAAMPNRTVIITTLNAAWAQEGSMIDMFLESFWHGDGTRKLLQHLVIVSVDKKAYKRCLVIHPHCLYIKTHGVDFSGEQLLLSADYIKLMWRRIAFLKTVLQMNYSFIFTDTDVLWLRDPFPRLQNDTEADFQIACDNYNGKPRDVHNHPNAGFIYVRANVRTVRFYDYWHRERKRGAKMADQEILNAIKFDKEFTSIGMKLRFLDTQFFGGFCALKTTDMSRAITMHATCCKGLQAKLIDLRTMLNGWKEWHAQNLTMSMTIAHNGGNVAAPSHNESMSPLALSPSPDVEKAKLNRNFTVPLACPQSWHKH